MSLFLIYFLYDYPQLLPIHQSILLKKIQNVFRYHKIYKKKILPYTLVTYKIPLTNKKEIR